MDGDRADYKTIFIPRGCTPKVILTVEIALVICHPARAVDHKLPGIVQRPGQVVAIRPAGAGVDHGGFRTGGGTQAEENTKAKQQNKSKTQCFHHVPPRIQIKGLNGKTVYFILSFQVVLCKKKCNAG